MTPSPITIEATLQPDGKTLQLERLLPLSPGRVTVTIQSTQTKSGPTMLEVLDRIHKDQRQRGSASITEEQMAADFAQMRAGDEESEQRWREIWSQTRTPPSTTETP